MHAQLYVSAHWHAGGVVKIRHPPEANVLSNVAPLTAVPASGYYAAPSACAGIGVQVGPLSGAGLSIPASTSAGEPSNCFVGPGEPVSIIVSIGEPPSIEDPAELPSKSPEVESGIFPEDVAVTIPPSVAGSVASPEAENAGPHAGVSARRHRS